MTRGFLRDLAERVVTTYIEAWVGLLLASQFSDKFGISTAKAAAVAAVPAALSVLKNALASRYGSQNSGSLLHDDPGPASA